MAAGDANRVWFEEVVGVLRSRWRPEISCEDLVDLAAHLNVKMLEIRGRLNILPPMLYCPKCQKYERAAAPKIRVRAIILGFGRFCLASEKEVADLEKKWRIHRRRNDLDECGAARLQDGVHTGSNVAHWADGKDQRL